MNDYSEEYLDGFDHGARAADLREMEQQPTRDRTASLARDPGGLGAIVLILCTKYAYLGA
jgi:hypothetical protein